MSGPLPFGVGSRQTPQMARMRQINLLSPRTSRAVRRGMTPLASPPAFGLTKESRLYVLNHFQKQTNSYMAIFIHRHRPTDTDNATHGFLFSSSSSIYLVI